MAGIRRDSKGYRNGSPRDWKSLLGGAGKRCRAFCYVSGLIRFMVLLCNCEPYVNQKKKSSKRLMLFLDTQLNLINEV